MTGARARDREILAESTALLADCLSQVSAKRIKLDPGTDDTSESKRPIDSLRVSTLKYKAVSTGGVASTAIMQLMSFADRKEHLKQESEAADAGTDSDSDAEQVAPPAFPSDFLETLDQVQRTTYHIYTNLNEIASNPNAKNLLRFVPFHFSSHSQIPELVIRLEQFFDVIISSLNQNPSNPEAMEHQFLTWVRRHSPQQHQPLQTDSVSFCVQFRSANCQIDRSATIDAIAGVVHRKLPNMTVNLKSPHIVIHCWAIKSAVLLSFLPMDSAFLSLDVVRRAQSNSQSSGANSTAEEEASRSSTGNPSTEA